MKQAEVARILEELRLECGGILSPEYVVERASESSHPLHDRFEWNDGEAAHKWRVHQARNLIHVHVRVEREEGPPIRAFVSLQQDRKEGLGYRSTVEVVKDPVLKEQLIEEARRDAESWMRKYAILEDVAATILRQTAKKLVKSRLKNVA